MPVDIDGDINLEGPVGRRLSFTASGASMRLAAADWQDLRSIGPRSLLAQRRAFVKAARLLERLDVGLSIDVAGRRVIRVGEGARPTVIARLLGLPKTTLPLGTAVSLLRARRLS